MNAALDLTRIAADLDREVARCERYADRGVRGAERWLDDAIHLRELFCQAHGWAQCAACGQTAQCQPFASAIAGEVGVCDRCRAVAR